MKREDIPHLRLVEVDENVAHCEERTEKPSFGIRRVNEFLDSKGLTWSTILIIGSAFTTLILFISLGIVSILSV